MNSTIGKTALVTNASSGIGKEFARMSFTAALTAGPLQAVYYATKAFVTSFSNAIAGVTLTQRMMLAARPIVPKKMTLR